MNAQHLRRRPLPLCLHLIFSVCLTMGTGLLFHPSPCPAFEGDEHKDLGNISIAANLEALKAAGGGGRTAEAKRVLELFMQGVQELPDLPPVTYGDIVLLVDYMKDNYRLLHRRSASEQWPANAAETDIAYLQKLTSDWLSNLGAAHDNQDHFQGRVLYAFWFWHKQAVETAAEGNLWAALLMNAYADHFLQDSFAPGHIISPRDENSQDVYATMIHDEGNRHAMLCHLQKLSECHQALSKVLRLSEKLHAGTVPELAQKLKRVKLLPEVGRQLLQHHEWEKRFYGDDQLNREPSQPVVMAAYCTQSVGDVVESYLSNSKKNSFTRYKFELRFAVAGGQAELIDVWQDYGDMTWKAPAKRDFYVGLPDKEARYGIKKVAASEIPERIIAPLPNYAAFNPAFALNIGYQGWATGYASEVRALTEAEMMVLGGRWDYLRDDFSKAYLPRKIDMFAVTVGYSGLFDSDTSANGIAARLILPINQLNLQLSLYGGSRYYSGNSYGGWRDYEGIRLDWGMQMGNLFLGIGRDFYPTTGGIKDGVSIQAGLSLAFPTSRIPGVYKSY
ncbi:hypothetical protein [Prosthecobacter vanneervenii]|uniref:Phospholipase C n=1 Tax=Prosthecobacter vanneervenii TaxID=48466 RepID=A0A7W8DIW7_9BACT|nr:hypothetical protein [Prosthecobacter vanneervenii]MBB5031457.1 hypothetical protein [Prosthecobacter vanneervenii]